MVKEAKTLILDIAEELILNRGITNSAIMT
jgi:hypothetical protein